MLGTIIRWFLIIVVLIIAAGFVLPDQKHVERSTVINATPEEVFALVGDFHAWDQWSPWANIDPDINQTITGEGLGSVMSWTSDHPQVGDGSQEIIEFEPPTKMTAALDFGDMGQAEATILLTPTDGGATEATWSFDTNMRDGVPVYMKPMATYMGFFMDGMLGPKYEEGLAALKEAAEAS